MQTGKALREGNGSRWPVGDRVVETQGHLTVHSVDREGWRWSWDEQDKGTGGQMVREVDGVEG